MEGLAVDGEDRHLRGAEQRRVVERADFQDHGGQARPPREGSAPEQPAVERVRLLIPGFSVK